MMPPPQTDLMREKHSTEHGEGREDLLRARIKDLSPREAAPNPYLEAKCEVAMGARKSGLSCPQLIQRIVEAAARRHGLGIQKRSGSRTPGAASPASP